MKERERFVSRSIPDDFVVAMVKAGLPMGRV